jgi:zinc protease
MKQPTRETVMLAFSAAAARRRGESLPYVRSLRSRRPWALALTLLLALMAGLAAAGGTADAAIKASHFVLGNGLEVVVVPDHRVPIATTEIWYKSAASEDPDGQTGVAHFVEHMMFQGTKRFPDDYYERFSVSNGGASINAYTTHDYTVYPAGLPKRHLAELLELEADRMVNLQITEKHVASELKVVMNERRGNENGPGYLLGEKINAALFPDHPYGRSVIGDESQIAKLNRAKALAFYKAHYAPNNAILVVAGDVTVDEVHALAEKYFGPIPAKADLAPRVIYPLPKKPATRRVELEHERVTTPSVGYSYLTPGVGAISQHDVYALDLVERITGTAIIGRLYRTLVREQHQAVGVSADYTLNVQAGQISFSATAAPGVSEADLEAALANQIAILARDGVTPSEVDDAKQGALAARAYEEDNHRQRASVYGRALARGLTMKNVEEVDDIIAGLTTADVNHVIAQFIAKGEPVIGVLRPRVLASRPPGAVK